MGMDGRINIGFHTRIFVMVLMICWVLVGTFVVFQYQREKEFKTILLDSQLQTFNSGIIEDLRCGLTADSAASHVTSLVNDIRLTLIARDGKVIYDNNDKTPFPTTDHNNRPEVLEARMKGHGHSSERHSESDDVSYFYSAQMGDDGVVVRSAAPYTHSLREFLKIDSRLIWFMIILTLFMSLFAYFATRKISTSIKRLNVFAGKAEKGEEIYEDEAFPKDELGSIASHIVRLYVQRDEGYREALRQEQDKIRLKKQLTNNINHELKTPVASILVSLELLREHPEMDESMKRDFMDRLYSNATRLDNLLKDISEITRMDEGIGVIRKSAVRLKPLIDNVVRDMRLRTDMKIVVDVPDITVIGNCSLLESVFKNLIDNAIAYSGGDTIVVKCDNECNFIVSDNGCGIPQEHLPYIFERFYRIDKGRSRESGGTGLGLAIVRNAVAIHGGKIKAESNKGLTFRFNLKYP